MASVVIKLHLKNHCIETAANKQLKSLTGQYFESSGSDDEILEKIELLQEFIKESDFPGLRAGDERLSGIVELFVNISRDSSNNFILSVEEPGVTI